MRLLTAAVAAALVTLTSACGGDTDPSPATQPTSAQSSASQSPASGGDRVLTGTVGEPGDPEAFTIAMTDSSGRAVTTLPAGTYEVRVNDLAEIHNFHLTGPGVDESTTVPGTGEVTWNVTFEPGSYTFVCDPHPRMTGQVTVT